MPRALLLPAALAALALAGTVAAYSRPETVAALLKAKATLDAHGPHWRAATANWVCTGTPGGPGCDPCAPQKAGAGGDEWWSEWDHIACRGGASYISDVAGGGQDGRVTNIHFTQGGVEGGWGGPAGDAAAIIDALCPIGQVGVDAKTNSSIAEFDLTASDPPITGPLPASFATCFPSAHKIKWSYNSLTGSLPGWIVGMPELSDFKVRANKFTGEPEMKGEGKGEGAAERETGRREVVEW